MRTLLRLLLTTTCVLACSSPVLATTYTLLSLEEMAAQADLAFRGTVRSSEAVLQDGDPWSRVVFEVTEVLRAADPPLVQDGLLTLEFLGGTADGIQLSVALMPQFTPGQEVILLVYDEPYFSPVVGFNQGLWSLADSGVWLGEDGVALALDDAGELQPGAADTDSERVLTALRQLLEAE